MTQAAKNKQKKSTKSPTKSISNDSEQEVLQKFVDFKLKSLHKEFKDSGAYFETPLLADYALPDNNTDVPKKLKSLQVDFETFVWCILSNSLTIKLIKKSPFYNTIISNFEKTIVKDLSNLIQKSLVNYQCQLDNFLIEEQKATTVRSLRSSLNQKLKTANLSKEELELLNYKIE